VTLQRAGLVTLHAVMISIVAVGESAAQNRPEIMALPPEATGYIRMGAIFHENFFGLAHGGPRSDVLAGVLEVRVEDMLSADAAFRAYARADLFQFQQLGVSPGGVVGLRRVQGANRFDLSVTGQWNRPRFDSGDELEQANILAARASYSLRVVSRLELIALGEYSRELLKIHSERHSRSREVGGAVRYRALRGRISLEGGFSQGGRDMSDPSQRYVEETGYVAVSTSVIPRTYISVRYRGRIREYTIKEAASRNFGREDRRRQLTAYLDLALWGNLVWNLSGGIDEVDSTKPGSAFRSRRVGTTLSVMLADW
jgi:hypothetical protein